VHYLLRKQSEEETSMHCESHIWSATPKQARDGNSCTRFDRRRVTEHRVPRWHRAPGGARGTEKDIPDLFHFGQGSRTIMPDKIEVLKK